MTPSNNDQDWVVRKAGYWEEGSVEGGGHTGQQETWLGRFADVSVTKTYFSDSTLHDISWFITPYLKYKYRSK